MVCGIGTQPPVRKSDEAKIFCIVNNVNFVFCFKARTAHSKISLSHLIGSGEEHVNFLIAINKINSFLEDGVYFICSRQSSK